MSLNVGVTPGHTMVSGEFMSVDDWNAAFRPSVTITGAVGASDLASNAVTFDALNPNLILSATVISSIGGADMLLVGSVVNGDNRGITFQNVLRSIVLESADVTAFADFILDRVVYWEANDNLPVRMGIARFFEQGLSQAPELTATVQDDSVLVHDEDAVDGQQAKRVSLRNLLPDIVTATTVNNPTQVVIDTKGRVISLSGIEGSNRFTSAETALPTVAGAATQVDIAHGLGAIPALVNVWLKCTDAGGDGSWAQNDVVDSRSVLFDTGASDVNTPFVVRVDATNVSIMRPAGASAWVPSKTDGTDQAFDSSKWKAIVQAMR